MPNDPIKLNDEIVIYHSSADECWIAHSLRTDQIGAGDRIMEALVTLIRGTEELLRLATDDETIAYLREAPPEIQAKLKDAQDLPLELYEVAHRIATGSWPQDLTVEVKSEHPDRLFKARSTRAAA